MHFFLPFLLRRHSLLKRRKQSLSDFQYAETERVSAYDDADWAGCPDSCRSTSGYLVYLGTNLVSWCFRKQPTIARSSAEFEYRSLSHASAETTWLAFLLNELGVHIEFLILLYCDNLNATYMASNHVFPTRTKHIELDYHFVCEKVAFGSHRTLSHQLISRQIFSLNPSISTVMCLLANLFVQARQV